MHLSFIPFRYLRSRPTNSFVIDVASEHVPFIYYRYVVYTPPLCKFPPHKLPSFRQLRCPAAPAIHALLLFTVDFHYCYSASFHYSRYCPAKIVPLPPSPASNCVHTLLLITLAPYTPPCHYFAQPHPFIPFHFGARYHQIPHAALVPFRSPLST